MTQEIIEMATQVYGECDWHKSALLHLEAFANLVAAKEREACAEVCEQSEILIEIDIWQASTKKEMTQHTALALAKASRARGEA
jgi:hypothetical protein